MCNLRMAEGCIPSASLKVSIFSEASCEEVIQHFSQFGKWPLHHTFSPVTPITHMSTFQHQATIFQKSKLSMEFISTWNVNIILHRQRQTYVLQPSLSLLIATASCSSESSDSVYLWRQSPHCWTDSPPLQPVWHSGVSMPYVFHGNPKYSFIEFLKSADAHSAATQSKQVISGSRVQVKMKPASTSCQSVSPSLKADACTSETRRSKPSSVKVSFFWWQTTYQ